MTDFKRRRTRRCVACGAERSGGEMLRVVRVQDGSVCIAAAGTQGRSAYVCPDEACIMTAQKRDAFSRSLKCHVEQSIYDGLKEMLRVCCG